MNLPDENDAVFKTGKWLGSHGFDTGVCDGGKDYGELQQALAIATDKDTDKDVALDYAILYLMKRHWSFWGLKGYKTFADAVKFYRKAKVAEYRKQIRALA